MDNALPHPEPHNHGHSHAHDHRHDLGHSQTHGHDHSRAQHHAHHHAHNHHHEIPAPAVSAGGRFSLIALSSLARLALAVPPVALLWLLTAWALTDG